MKTQNHDRDWTRGCSAQFWKNSYLIRSSAERAETTEIVLTLQEGVVINYDFTAAGLQKFAVDSKQ